MLSTEHVHSAPSDGTTKGGRIAVADVWCAPTAGNDPRNDPCSLARQLCHLVQNQRRGNLDFQTSLSGMLPSLALASAARVALLSGGSRAQHPPSPVKSTQALPLAPTVALVQTQAL